MQQIFKNALYFTEPIVLNRQLLPLCCSHVMTLMVSDSPYVIPGETPNLIHLAFAVGICSRTHEEGECWIKSPSLLDDVKKWGKECRKLNFPNEGKKFESYLKTFSEFPERRSKTENPQPCQHPWPLLIATSIMPLVGESRAWNMPLPKAISIWSASLEAQGDQSLVTDWELWAREQEKAKKAKQLKDKK